MALRRIIPLVVLVVLPWSLGLDIKQATLDRYKINGDEWKQAQSIINNLVDESIANRVTEAQRDMTSLLEQNIDEHIKTKSKKYLSGVKKDCKDKIEHCDSLAAAGVCKTSTKAMKSHCAKTCNFCQREYIEINPQVEIVMKPKLSSHVRETAKKTETDTVKQEMKAAALRHFYHGSEPGNPSDSLTALHSIEPLLSQQSSVAMKYHDNEDMSTENEKIKDAQKLLEYVKVLRTPKKHVSVPRKVAPKSDSHENAAKKHITKNVKTRKGHRKSHTKKLKGVPMEKLSKTVTYKNQKYKITPIVDWKKITKMLKSLGYKAIHIVGMKNKHLEKGLKDHLQKNGVTKVITGKQNVHAAAETFVSATHRHKSWHNEKYFKEKCHPLCLVACVSSCGAGCCKEKVSLHTGVAKHCHHMCLTNCVPSCGSGCCSKEEEEKRGHKFIHFDKVKKFQKNKDQPTKQEEVEIHDKPKITKTVIKETKGTKETEKVFLSVKDVSHLTKLDHPIRPYSHLSSPDLFKPQIRSCPGTCNQVCAPACADSCCGFGDFASSYTSRENHPGLRPNVPYPNKGGIPGTAYLCSENCKFNCDQSCSADCCDSEGIAARNSLLQELPYPYTQPQPMGYEAIQTFNDPPGMCPNPCPGTCLPACNVACCTAALGLPQVDSNAEARSSTQRVIHIKHVIHPLERKGLVPGSCAAYCVTHCTPICARSGCCA